MSLLGTFKKNSDYKAKLEKMTFAIFECKKSLKNKFYRQMPDEC